jgi:hypothetical protein
MRILTFVLVVICCLSITNYCQSNSYEMSVVEKDVSYNENHNVVDYLITFKHKRLFSRDEIWFCHTINTTLWKLYRKGDAETFTFNEEDNRPERLDFECYNSKSILADYLNEY